MNNYLWWPAVLVLLCIGSATCAHKSNATGSMWWSTGVVILSVCFGLLYAAFMKHTRDPILDNFIYNAIIAVTVTSTFIWFGCAMSFKWEQWLGMCLMLSGLLLFNLRIS